MIIFVLACAILPAFLFCFNLLLYRQPPLAAEAIGPVSVLIPARNEEGSIEAAVKSVLASKQIEFELIVLDDASTDSTAAIVRGLAALDDRLRLEQAPPLPSGWNGKQHACHVLASLARYDTLCFLDADVRVDPLCLARMATFLQQSNSALVSGFPLQQTETILEKLLLPLIHFVLLGFLPLIGLKLFRATPAFAAGCGQFMMARRDAYQQAGGHASIRATMHDGLLLPKLLRRHHFATELADLTRLATCRMYRSASEVWKGLSKNATEGIAAPARIVPFTVLLFAGQVLPFLLLPFAQSTHDRHLLLIAAGLAYLPRILAALQFRQSWLGALLHPVGISVLLALEWIALFCKAAGVKSTWKQRAYDAG